MFDFDVFQLHDAPLTLREVLFAFTVTLVLTQIIAMVYIWTFRGMSYTRSYVLAIVVGGVVATMMMLAINNNVAAGLGIAGSLAFVRFRTSVRDPRDMVFVFAALGAGVASGLRAHMIAIVGVGAFCFASIVLTLVEFGSVRQFDGLLRFVASASSPPDALTEVLRKYTRRFALITMREVNQGRGLEHAYHVKLKGSSSKRDLVALLQSTHGVDDVSYLDQEDTVEI